MIYIRGDTHGQIGQFSDDVMPGDPRWSEEGGWAVMMRDLITLFRMALNLKLMNCLFLEFSIYYFRTTVGCK